MLAYSQPAPALTAIVASKDLPRGTGEHGLAAIDHDRSIMDVGIVEPACDACPALPAVSAAPHTVHLDTSPHHPMVGRIHGQRRHPRYADVRAFIGQLDPKLLPMLSAVRRSEQRRGPRASEDDARIRRIESDLPDVKRIHRRIHSIEMLAAVLAAIDAVIRPGQQHPGFRRMDREAEYAAFGPQTGSHLTPAFAAIRTDPGAGPDGSDADRKVAGHDSTLPV